MTIKLLHLCLLIGSSFKQFVKFLHSSAAQLLKLRLQTKPSLKQIFLHKPFAKKIFEFVTYIVLTRGDMTERASDLVKAILAR